MAASPVTRSECGLEELRARLKREPGALFAVLDACDEPLVPEKVHELGKDRAVSLYRGTAEQEYWAIAPYLVQVDEALLDWILAQLPGDRWGIFFVASADLGSLRKHFRHFLKVVAPDGKQVFFRFYDPRVLPTFLATCTPDDATEFYGPVERFYVTRGPGTLQVIQRAKT